MAEGNAIQMMSMIKPQQRGAAAASDPFAAGFEQLLFMEYEKSFAAAIRVLSALDAMLEALIQGMGREVTGE